MILSVLGSLTFRLRYCYTHWSLWSSYCRLSGSRVLWFWQFRVHSLVFRLFALLLHSLGHVLRRDLFVILSSLERRCLLIVSLFCKYYWFISKPVDTCCDSVSVWVLSQFFCKYNYTTVYSQWILRVKKIIICHWQYVGCHYHILKCLLLFGQTLNGFPTTVSRWLLCMLWPLGSQFTETYTSHWSILTFYNAVCPALLLKDQVTSTNFSPIAKVFRPGKCIWLS